MRLLRTTRTPHPNPLPDGRGGASRSPRVRRHGAGWAAPPVLNKTRTNGILSAWTRFWPGSCASSRMPPNTMRPAPPRGRPSARRPARRARLDHGGGHLPRLHAGRALHLAAEDPADQLLPVRLRLLRQPALLERAAGEVHGRGGGDAHGRVLQAQLHRGSVPLLGHHPLPDHTMELLIAGGEVAAARPRLSRLYPPEVHPRGEPLADRGGGALGRPALDQPRTADGGRAWSAWRRRRTAPRSQGAMAQIGERIAEAKAERRRFSPGRAIDADDRRRRRDPRRGRDPQERALYGQLTG